MRTFARRSTTITLTLLSSTAAAVLSACGRSRRDCVDAQNRVVADSLCRDYDARAATHGGSAWYPYRYYYGGRGYAGVGSILSGGSYAAPRSGYGGSGAHIGGGTSRGGFGGIGAGHGFSGS